MLVCLSSSSVCDLVIMPNHDLRSQHAEEQHRRQVWHTAHVLFHNAQPPYAKILSCSTKALRLICKSNINCQSSCLENEDSSVRLKQLKGSCSNVGKSEGNIP